MHKVRLGNEEYTVGKIVCVGRNYAEHAKELGNEVPEYPIIFLKPPSALIYDGGTILYPTFSQDVHHEAELVLLIGKDFSRTEPGEAESAVAGYAVGLDMTARDVQNELRKKGSPWTMAKCFDTSAAVSDFVSAAAVADILEETIELKVNGAVRQHASLKDMIFPPAELVRYISGMMKLEAGDLIYTGTPKGVSAVLPGDVIEAGIGTLCALKVSVA